MFFQVFQGFSRFFNVFKVFFPCFFGFFQGFSEEGLPPRPFSQPNFGQGGVVFLDFKGKIVFGDPPCLKLRPPLERESLPQKTPQKETSGLA